LFVISSISEIESILHSMTAIDVVPMLMTCSITLIYRQKLALMKYVFYGYFVGAEHEYDTKNCCLALVSKLQEVAFLYRVLWFHIMFWVINDKHGCLMLWLMYMMWQVEWTERRSRKLTIRIYPLPSDQCLMGNICPCQSHQKISFWIRRWKRKTRRKQDLTKNLQIQTSKVQHLSHLTNLHKMNWMM